MNKFNSSAALAAALALALSGASFAMTPPVDPVTTPPVDSMTTPPVDPLPAPETPVDVSFEQLDTDADGYISRSDVPVEHELSVQFAVADTDQDSRLSRDEFNAYRDEPVEEEEAEE